MGGGLSFSLGGMDGWDVVYLFLWVCRWLGGGFCIILFFLCLCLSLSIFSLSLSDSRGGWEVASLSIYGMCSWVEVPLSLYM